MEMEKWEYLDVILSYERNYWIDSSGNNGQLDRITPEGFSVCRFAQTLLDELGDEGWELTASQNDHLIFKRKK
jgi:hypothetical protein